MILEKTAGRQAELLSILRREFDLSVGLVKRLKWQNALFVNDAPAHTNCRVFPGDRVRVVIEEEQEGFLPEPMDLSILYEDEAILAVDKPAGLLVHPSPQRNSGTLANGVLHHLRQRGEAAGIHPVTRLDRDTFGVVLLAKNAYVHELMRRQHAGGGMEKTYHALTCGIPDPPEGEIDAPIARVPGDSLLREIRPDGKPASSRYRVLEARAGCAKLELSPLTGRTHQLRLHCAYLGCPILGDPQYGTPGSLTLSARYGIAGQQLCAVRLRFLHPMTKKTVEIRAAGDVSLDFLERTVV